MYIIDTSLYIQALRDPDFASALESFQETAFPQLWLSAVVTFEIMLGAFGNAREELYQRWLVLPFSKRNRVLAPDERSWRMAARMHREIRALGGFEAKLRLRSFYNDMLIAATCRQVGATLLTANRSDYELLNRVMGVRYLTHFPAM